MCFADTVWPVQYGHVVLVIKFDPVIEDPEEAVDLDTLKLEELRLVHVSGGVSGRR